MPAWTEWPRIECRDPSDHEHVTVDIEVDLSERHGYMDCPPIPEWLQVFPFRMEVWDWTKGPYDPFGPWCPARCVVSQTIADLGIWEPRETLALMHMFELTRLEGERWTFLDIGAQLGWFSILALKFGLDVVAVEADPEVAAVLSRNLDRNGTNWHVTEQRIVPGNVFPIFEHPTIVKIDIEGAEPEAIQALGPNLANGMIRGLMIEISPSFGIDYRPMIETLIGYGYEPGFLPGKSDPPLPMNGLDRLLWHWTVDEVMDIIDAHGQVNVFFKHDSFEM